MTIRARIYRIGERLLAIARPGARSTGHAVDGTAAWQLGWSITGRDPLLAATTSVAPCEPSEREPIECTWHTSIWPYDRAR